MSVNRVQECEFRPRRYYLILGVTCAIGSGVFGSAFVYAAAANIGGSVPHPIRTAVLFGVFWGAWFIASLWLIAEYFREQLRIESGAITQDGVLLRRSVPIAEIRKLEWHVRPLGHVAVIHYPAGRMNVYLENFTANERTLLIELLRQIVPEQQQDNWDAFNKSLQPGFHRPQKRFRSTGIVCQIAFFTIGAAFILFWYNNGGNAFLLAGAANIAVSIWYLIRVCRFLPDLKYTA